MVRLTNPERDFLERVRDSRPLKLADRKEDKVRQRVKKLGFAECVMGPRRWIITDAGRAALERSEG